MQQSPITYHIIGGGIAGLTCARILKQKHPEIRSVVYETAETLGGRARSYNDAEFGCKLDIGTHVIIGANKKMREFVQSEEWEPSTVFWNAEDGSVSEKLLPALGHILKSCGNTPANKVAPQIRKYILRHTFPWTRNKRKVYFSKQDLSQRIINVLAAYAGEIRLGCKLLKIETQFGRAVQLNFSNTTVDVGTADKVILALDNRHCARILGTEELPHNSIINIFYRTSQTIFLPKGASYIGVVNGLADWIFVNGNILTATISAADENATDFADLARKVWCELDKIRGVNSAFVPPFKVLKHKHATIAQDAEIDAMRPLNAETQYPNVFIAGDWTMQGRPCCMETAVLSAERAIKTAIKS